MNGCGLQGGTAPTPAREKRQRGTSSRPTRPFSRPHAQADRRKTAALFGSGAGVQCRDRLPAGGSRIRTSSPASRKTAFRHASQQLTSVLVDRRDLRRVEASQSGPPSTSPPGLGLLSEPHPRRRQRAGLWTPTNRVRKCSHRISGRPVGDQLFFRRVLARLQNPELQAVADLRRHAAALQRAHPFRPLIQLAAGRSATNVDWSITWLPARRRDGFGLRSCRARRRARTRLPRRCSIGPRFLLRKKPSAKRCDARGPSRNRPTVAPPIPRTEGKLTRNVFEISDGDDQLVDVKSPSACALFSG